MGFHTWPLHLEKGWALGIEVELKETHLAIVSTEGGYIMCGALDVKLLDDRLGDRRIVAGRALGVRSVDDLLKAPLESVTKAAREIGLRDGMSGRDAVNVLLSRTA